MKCIFRTASLLAVFVCAPVVCVAADTNEPGSDKAGSSSFRGSSVAATRTIFLDSDGDAGSVASPVAYHPAFDRYYGSGSGNTSVTGLAFGSSGGLPVSTVQPLNIDPRSWVYNANTAQLEVVSFDAVDVGTDQGLILPGVDAAGDLTGGTTELLASLPGLDGNQTAPAYDAGDDVFYSRSNSNSVNVVNRSDGSLAGTITLDFSGAGISSVVSDGIVYVPAEDLLGVLDASTDLAVFFNMDGTFASAAQLDVDVTSASRRPGFANGQLFVFDGARAGWQGYAIFELAESRAIPTLSTSGLALLSLVMAALALVMLRGRISG